MGACEGTEATAAGNENMDPSCNAGGVLLVAAAETEGKEKEAGAAVGPRAASLVPASHRHLSIRYSPTGVLVRLICTF